MSSGAIVVRYVKKLHFMNVILNFAEEKVFPKHLDVLVQVL